MSAIQSLLTRLEHQGSRRLSAGVSHELNNLVAMLQGFTDLAMLDTEPDHPAYSSLEAIGQACRKLATYSETLSVYAETGTPASHPIEPAPVLTQLCQEFPGLDLTLGEELPGVWMTREDLASCLRELCQNARRASRPEAGFSLWARRQRLESGELGRPDARPGVYLQVGVEDRGAGMDGAWAVHVLTPHVRDRTGGGKGLGLPRALGLLGRGGGWLEVRTSPGLGTCMVVSLPEDCPHGTARPGPVLLVEPQEDKAAVLRLFLEASGCSVTWDRNWEQASSHLAGKPFERVVAQQPPPEGFPPLPVPLVCLDLPELGLGTALGHLGESLRPSLPVPS